MTVSPADVINCRCGFLSLICRSLWLTIQLAVVCCQGNIKEVAKAAAAGSDVSPLRYSVIEEIPKGTIVADLVVDAGLRRKYPTAVLALLEFRILSPPPLPFVVELKTGILRTDGVVDRDSLMQCKDKSLCEIVLDVTVRPTQYFQIIKVTIEIEDINDNEPYFKDRKVSVSVRESSSVGTSVSLPVAFDLDSPNNAVKSYELINETPNLGLSVTTRRDGSLDPRLVVLVELDRELEDSYELRLVASDGGVPPKSAFVDIVVHVLDSNDHSPQFERSNYEVNVTENAPLGTVIMKVHASDKDAGLNGEVTYRLSDQTIAIYGRLFGVNNRTGEISIQGGHRLRAIHRLSAGSPGRGPRSGLAATDAAVIVRVLDLNDNVPVMTVSTLTARKAESAEVAENLAIGAFVAHVSVVDADGGSNGRVSCNISEPEFTLVERYNTEFQVLTAAILDRETRDRYDVELVCWDGGLPPLMTRKKLPVVVKDVNDHPPEFSLSSYSVRMTENNEVGHVVVQVSASDRDTGMSGQFHYTLSPGGSGVFDIDGDGFILAKTSVDREMFSSYSFTVLAVDHGTPPLTGTALVIIGIDDVNDEKPIFGQSSYLFSVGENEPEGTPVGTVTAEDRDVSPHNVIHYAFASSSGHTSQDCCFSIDPDSGNIFTTVSFDREVRAVYRLVIVAADNGQPPFSGTASVTVFIQDQNDNTPIFKNPPPDTNDTTTIHISNAVPKGYIATQVSSFDLDLDKNGRVQYSLERGNEDGAFTIDTHSGIISVNTRFADVSYKEYELTVAAKDCGSPIRSAFATIRVHVNSSVVYRIPQTSGRIVDTDSNLLWIVIIVCASTMVTLILLLLIGIAMRRSRRRKKSQRYKCRMEALRALTAKELAGCTPAENTPLTMRTQCNGNKSPLSPHNGIARNGDAKHLQQV